MKWILIWAIASYDGASTQSQVFINQVYCESAAAKIMEASRSIRYNTSFAFCVPDDWQYRAGVKQ